MTRQTERCFWSVEDVLDQEVMIKEVMDCFEKAICVALRDDGSFVKHRRGDNKGASDSSRP